METTKSLVRIIAAAALLLVAYTFVMASFAFFAMFGFGIVMGVFPFWFGLPPIMKWAHETAASLARPRRRLLASAPPEPGSSARAAFAGRHGEPRAGVFPV